MRNLMLPLTATQEGTTWVATAPSNIAWIKYMGKRDFIKNIPTNRSLSLLAPQCHTTVRVTPIAGDTDQCLVDDRTPLMNGLSREDIQFILS